MAFTAAMARGRRPACIHASPARPLSTRAPRAARTCPARTSQPQARIDLMAPEEQPDEEGSEDWGSEEQGSGREFDVDPAQRPMHLEPDEFAALLSNLNVTSLKEANVFTLKKRLQSKRARNIAGCVAGDRVRGFLSLHTCHKHGM